MAEVGSAYLTVFPKAPGFERALGQETDGAFDTAGRRGGALMGQGVEKGGRGAFAAAGKSVGAAFSSAFAALGVTLTISAVASAVKDFAMDSIRAASDLGESVNAVNVTFDEAADGILKLGENASTAVGLSRNEFNGLAVQFSAFATTIAGKGGNVVKVMDDLTSRGADFASVMNLDVAEAMQLFQSGLAGETEPLRQYGIDLSAAAVETYALANGIVKSGEEMTEAEKVQARYGLLMEQTAKTTGDFATTSDSMANRQRILNAEFENTKAQVGEALLPIMNDLMGFLLDEGIPILKDMAIWAGKNETAIRDWVLNSVDLLLSLVQVFLAVGAGFAGMVQGTAIGLRFLTEAFYAMVLGVNSALINLAEMYDGVFGTNNAQALKDRRKDLEGYRDTAVAKLGEVERSAGAMKDEFNSGITAINTLRASIDGLKDKDVHVRTHVTQLANGRTRTEQTEYRAAGGPVAAGKPYIVGEFEQELFIPDRPGVIYNQAQIRAAVGQGGGSGVTQNIYPQAGQDEVTIGRVAADQLTWAARR